VEKILLSVDELLMALKGTVTRVFRFYWQTSCSPGAIPAWDVF